MAPVSALIPECSLRSSCITQFALDNASDAVLWSDGEGRLLYANQAAAQLLGRSVGELLAGPLQSISPEIADRLATPGRQPFETACTRPGGQQIPVEVTVSSFALGGHSCHCMFLRDLSERKRLELQLRQAHTMEAVGRLVDGVSHDFNNLLTAVMIYSGLMSTQLDETSPLRPQLDHIMQAAEDGRALVANLLGLGRRSASEIGGAAVDVDEVVKGMSQMLERLLAADIRLTVDCSRGVARAQIDWLQIEQVLLNLALNARDAMPDGGDLDIHLCDRNVQEPFARDRRGLKAGRYVQIQVRDTGCGMDAETLSHIFEPFFTTKPKGRGTGLGMATVYGIVQQCGGSIEVESQPGRGTTVTILLPQAEPAAVEEIPPPANEAEVSGSETVLLVEDEALVRRSVNDILSGSGYRVLEASNAQEAVCAAESFPGRIHLMLTDLVLPGTGGLELAAGMKRRRPDMRVLFISGYGDDPRVRRVAESGEPFCAKPFTAAALSQKMREVLAAPAPNAR